MDANTLKAKNKLLDKKLTHRKIESPELLWSYFKSYCDLVDSTPWKKTDFKGKDATPVVYEFFAPYTWQGFNIWLFNAEIIANLTHYQYNLNNAYEDFKEVIQLIDKVIYDRKLTGASLGFYNHAIIARDLGMVEKKQVEQNTTILNLGSGVDPSQNEDDLM